MTPWTVAGEIRRKCKPSAERLRGQVEAASCCKTSENIRFRLRALAGRVAAIRAALADIERDARAEAESQRRAAVRGGRAA